MSFWLGAVPAGLLTGWVAVDSVGQAVALGLDLGNARQLCLELLDRPSPRSAATRGRLLWRSTFRSHPSQPLILS